MEHLCQQLKIPLKAHFSYMSLFILSTKTNAHSTRISTGKIEKIVALCMPYTQATVYIPVSIS